MKTVLTTLILFSFTSLFAQIKESDSNTNNGSKLSFGWIYSPEVSYRVLSEGSNATEITPSIIALRNDTERAKFGQTFSFFLGYELSKRFSLEGGFGFTDFGEGREPIDFILSPIDPLFSGTVTGTNHIAVASIPLTLHMTLGGKKVKGFISAGIAPSFLMRIYSNSRTEYANGDVKTSSNYSPAIQENYSKFILGAHVSGGIDYQYNEKASLRIAPVFRMTATTVYPNAPVQGNYFNAGIEIGTIYTL